MGVIDGLDPSYTDIQEPFTQTHTDRVWLLDPQHTQKHIRPLTQTQAVGNHPPPTCLPYTHRHTHTHTAPQHFSTPPWNSPAQVLLETATSSQLRQRLGCQLPALPQVASLPIHTSLSELVPPLGPPRWWSDPESPSIPVDTCPRPLPIHPSLPIFPPLKERMMMLPLSLPYTSLPQKPSACPLIDANP